MQRRGLMAQMARQKTQDWKVLGLILGQGKKKWKIFSLFFSWLLCNLRDLPLSIWQTQFSFKHDVGNRCWIIKEDEKAVYVQWITKLQTGLVFRWLWSVPFPDVWKSGHVLDLCMANRALERGWNFFSYKLNGIAFGLKAQICIQNWKFIAFNNWCSFDFGRSLFDRSLNVNFNCRSNVFCKLILWVYTNLQCTLVYLEYVLVWIHLRTTQ